MPPDVSLCSIYARTEFQTKYLALTWHEHDPVCSATFHLRIIPGSVLGRAGRPDLIPALRSRTRTKSNPDENSWAIYSGPKLKGGVERKTLT